MMCGCKVLQLLRSMQVGMAQASTEHVSRAGTKVENLEQQAFMARRPCCPEAKMACMHEQRSFCCTRSPLARCTVTLHYVITEPVGVTYICHGPDSRPRGLRLASARRARRLPDSQIRRAQVDVEMH
jgi:hypothetical protein